MFLNCQFLFSFLLRGFASGYCLHGIFLSSFKLSIYLCLWVWSAFLIDRICCCCCLVTQSCPALWDPRDCSMPGFPILHYLPEFSQIHVYLEGDVIQPSHLLSPPFPPALNLSQYLGLFLWACSLHQVAKVLDLQPQKSVLPMNIQDWFPLGLTGLISLQSKGLLKVFSALQFESIKSLVLRLFYGPTLTWLLEKP